MEFISFESVCRCCLSNSGSFSSIFEIYNDYYMPKVINACTGVTILQSDGLPDVLCETCLLKLITAYETRRLFLRSNGQLKEQLNRLQQSEREILIELNSTAAKCASSSNKDDGLMPSVETIMEEGPITTWDNEINMHIEQLQDEAGELGANIGDCLDELVIEKYENLEKGGYSFPISEAVDLITECNGRIAEFGASSPRALDVEDEQEETIYFPSFSDYSESSEETEEHGENNSDVVATVEAEPQNCVICGKTYRNARLLQRHVQYHNANKINCPICSKTFAHTSNLKRHINSHKPPIDGFSCSKCPQKFSKGVHLYDHLKIHKISTDEASSYTMHCDRCVMETTSLASFVAHMAQEHGVPKEKVKAFSCHICELRFVSKQGMLRHIKSVHQNQKPVHNRTKKFLCPECGKCFQRLHHLEAHANSHAGIRPYICECGLSFSQQSGLTLHIRAKHENRKAHTCQICGKSFAQSTHLKHHELIHSNRKEHECAVCKHRFRVKSNLVAHMRIHRKHPYCCSECGREFVQSVKLENHMLMEHCVRSKPAGGE